MDRASKCYIVWQGTAMTNAVRCTRGTLGCQKTHLVPIGCIPEVGPHAHKGKCLQGTESCRVYHMAADDPLIVESEAVTLEAAEVAGSAEEMLKAAKALNPKPFRTHTARILSQGPLVASRCHPNNPHTSHAACTEPWCECVCHDTPIETALRGSGVDRPYQPTRSEQEEALLRFRAREDARRGITKAFL